MLKLAVVGKDVSASQSPQIHAFVLGKWGVGCSYEKVSVPYGAFCAEDLFSRFDAFNVTIPFKTKILPFLRALEGDARVFGAVNTVVSATRTGYNTDGRGFLLMLGNAGVDVKGVRTLVLGAGGAGRSCIRMLADAGAEVFVYERDPERLRAVHREFGDFTPLAEIPRTAFGLVVNCTGIGMHDTVGQTPEVRVAGGGTERVGTELLSRADVAVDLIYEPARSRFLGIAEELGKRTVNGSAMLFYQAYLADCIYLGRTPDPAEAKRFWEEYKEETL